MAFLRNCKKRCDWPGCDRAASEDERFGFYCSRHAASQLRYVQADEQKLFARQRAEQ